MEMAIWLLALTSSAALAVPAIIYCLECVAGSWSLQTQHRPAHARRPKVAVLIPAHNEEDGLFQSMATIIPQLRPGDRLLVVADNCSDATAAIGRAAGAEVIERTDLANRGKGFALDYGLSHLAHNPPEVVIFVDADCRVLDDSIDELSRLAAHSGRPVQCCNLMKAREDQRQNFGVAEFAFLVKNLVRPRGLQRFGLPCQLTGTGMALPWVLIGRAQFGHSGLVEDMKLGLDLAAAGHPPLYCENAGVLSAFPDTDEGALTQRRRWEHGHLAMVSASCRRLLSPHILRSRHALAMTLDVIVPPLTLLMFLLFVAASSAAVVALLGYGIFPLIISTASLLAIIASTALAWALHGQTALPASALKRMPRYLLGKALIYPQALAGRSQQSWIRTDRRRA